MVRKKGGGDIWFSDRNAGANINQVKIMTAYISVNYIKRKLATKGLKPTDHDKKI